MSHILMSHVTCMSHVTYEFVTLHISMRRVTSVSHMTYEWVMWHMNEWGHMNESCWHVNEAGHTCQPCMSHPRVMPRMNEWGHMNESCWHVNEAGHTCQPCMSHPRVMPHMNGSECTYQSVISRASTIRTPYEWFPLLFPPSPLNRHHTRAIFENSLCTMNAGFQISGSFSTIKASCPSPPLTLPRPPSFVGILLLVILGLPFRKLSASKKKRQTLSTWHGHTGRFKDNQKTRTMPTKWGWIQVFDGLSPKYCNLYVLAEFV